MHKGNYVEGVGAGAPVYLDNTDKLITPNDNSDINSQIICNNDNLNSDNNGSNDNTFADCLNEFLDILKITHIINIFKTNFKNVNGILDRIITIAEMVNNVVKCFDTNF